MTDRVVYNLSPNDKVKRNRVAHSWMRDTSVAKL